MKCLFANGSWRARRNLCADSGVVPVFSDAATHDNDNDIDVRTVGGVDHGPDCIVRGIEAVKDGDSSENQ
jgi:hypothetical protein